MLVVHATSRLMPVQRSSSYERVVCDTPALLHMRMVPCMS